jgi:UDP-2,4-diacetamido-2,4,6-trideoxy-beta-L-altropyranose hydrolase
LSKKLKKNNNLILRVDGGKKLGFGHLYRALILIKNIKNFKFKIFIERDIHGFNFLKKRRLEVKKISKKDEFKKFEEANADTLILDSIIVSKNTIKKYKKKFQKLIIFEDLGDKGQNYANLIFNSIVNGPRHKIEKIKYGIRYIGAKYKILNTQSIQKKMKKDNFAVISFGGGDYNRKTIFKIINITNALSDLKIKTKIIYGPGVTKKTISQIQSKTGDIKVYNKPKQIHSILKKSLFLFCAGGGTIYDGIINKCIIFYSPINYHQKKNISNFQKIKCGFLINNFKTSYLKKYIRKVINDKILINQQLKKYKNIIQENGIIEVAKILNQFLNKN